MKFSFKPSDEVCCTKINFEIDDDVVKNVVFEDGCNGNLQGIGKLAEGRSIDEIISLLGGIECDGKPTSCPDQFAKALPD